MSTVTVITTGGTIGSAAVAGGGKAASVPGARILQGLTMPVGVDVRLVDLLRVNSYAMTFADMDRVRAAVSEALADPNACGVVVTHGTDTLEETAMLVDLSHDDPRPVVFTGAQLSFDDPDGDGSSNLGDAISVAASTDARGLGVLISFGGALHAARGTRKAHNTATAGFADADHGPLGDVVDGAVHVHTRIRRTSLQIHQHTAIAPVRVDTVAIYPGVDRVALDAVVAAGARGVVLQATGIGNANAEIATAVKELSDAGVAVVLSSRVAAGAIRPVYGGGGGGVDLVDAGAIPAGLLRPSQARVLLAALLAEQASRTRIAEAFATDAERHTETGDPNDQPTAAN